MPEHLGRNENCEKIKLELDKFLLYSGQQHPSGILDPKYIN